MDNLLNTPVLIIAFNRPEIIRKTFAYVRAARPSKLYIAVDGPRTEKDGEELLVQSVKNEFANIDWNCEVYHRYNDSNKGAEVTVSSAVSWVLEHEECVIVLEDDVVAPLAFLKFAEEMLLRYAKNQNVYMISGGNFTPMQQSEMSDYFFAQSGHTSCGWATWRRAWDKFSLDADMNITREELSPLFLTEREICYKYKYYRKFAKNKIGTNTWDVCWAFVRVKNRGLSVIPRVNLTSNIGVFGLHYKGRTEHHFLEYDDSFKVNCHPAGIERNKEYDKYHFNKFVYVPFWKRVISKLKSIVK